VGKSQVEKLFVSEVRETRQSGFNFCWGSSAFDQALLPTFQVAVCPLGLAQPTIVSDVFTLGVHPIHLN